MEQKSQKTKKNREKENAILDSVSPKFNRSMVAYHETGDLFADTCDEKIHHLADQMISIDLDDGVKKNYAMFQDVLAKIK